MDIFFDELISINNFGMNDLNQTMFNITVDLFRLENYDNSTLDLIIFGPCVGPWHCDRSYNDLKFETIDLRNNKNLKYIGTLHDYRDYDGKISVQSFLASNCSLIENKEIAGKRFSINGLLVIGRELEHLDLSHNYITEIEAGYGRWPSLKTLNLSWNQITDLGKQWFEHIPNVDVIDLSHNYIQNLLDEAFTINNPDPNKIEKEILIDLSHNRLSEDSRFYNTIFENLKRPSKFNLQHNDFHSLPEIFAKVLNKRGYSIDMGNNQLICDCKSEWIRSMAVIYESRLNNYSCLNLNNESIFKITKNLCNNY